MKEKLYLKYHQLIIKVTSKFGAFTNFLTLYFKNNVIDFADRSNISLFFEIVNEGESENKIRDVVGDDKVEKLARKIWVAKNFVVIEEVTHCPGLKLIYKILDEKLEIFAYFEMKRGLRNYLKRTIFKNEYYLRLNLLLKYYLILFPIFWYFEYFKDVFLIHASAIAINDQAVIFPGLGGSGKSTFVLSMMNNNDTLFVSDNLILFDKKTVYSCFESVALDRKSIDYIGNAMGIMKKLNIPMSHNRQYYHVNEKYSEFNDAKSVVFMKFSYKNYIEPISKSECVNKIHLINFIAKEVQEYQVISSILNMVVSKDMNTKKYKALNQFINQLDCYELGIIPDTDPKQFISQINSLS